MADNLAYDLTYQDAWKEELIGGKVVAMSPASTKHNRISDNIFGIFWSYLRGKPCIPFGDGESVYLTENDEFIPDFMIVCDRNKIRDDGIHGAPDLVVEVLSPSTAKNDKGRKKEVYAKAGVREYWIVSPSEKSVEVYRSSGRELVLHDIYTVRSEWMRSRLSPAEQDAIVTRFTCSLYDDFEISLDDIFYDLLP